MRSDCVDGSDALARRAAPALGLRERLRQRRQHLIHRSAVLRERMARHGAALVPGLALLDRARSSWAWLRAHPWVPLAGLALLTLRRPRLLWRAVFMAWRGWRAWQRYGPVWQRWLTVFRHAQSRS